MSKMNEAAFNKISAHLQKAYGSEPQNAILETAHIRSMLGDEAEMNVTFRHGRSGTQVHPKHDMVKHWGFDDKFLDESYNEKEANLADAMARVAEANGMNQNDLMQLFPAVLRMLKSNSEWSGNTK